MSITPKKNNFTAFLSALSSAISALGALLLDLTLLLSLVGAVCFSKLDTPSIDANDETTHVRAVQEMFHGGSLLQPTVKGIPYNNKPPLKMWLSLIPLHYWGESASSYRFIDAGSGVLTCLLLYLAGRVLFSSRIVGLLAALLLISSPMYVHGHGVRKAVQDSFFIFLNTAASLLVFAMLRNLGLGEDVRPGSRGKAIFFALLSAFFVGAAVLTKNILGFFPWGLLLLYLLLSGSLLRSLKLHYKIFLPALLLSLIIPAAYFVPLFYLNPEALKVYLGDEVVRRVAERFHNGDDPWFYLKDLFVDRISLAPEVFLAGLALAFWKLRQSRFGIFPYLLIWALLPITVFSLIPSRLSWYVSLGLPAMALLGAAACRELWAKCAGLWIAHNQGNTQFIRLALSSISSMLLFASLSYQSIQVGSYVLNLKPRNAYDLLSSEIAQQLKANPPKLNLLTLKAPPPSRAELTYWGMIERMSREISREELAELGDAEQIIFTNREEFLELAKTLKIRAYRHFAANLDRDAGLFVVQLGGDKVLTQLSEPKMLYDFGRDSQVETLFGLEESPGAGMQAVIASRASFVVEPDAGQRALGLNCKLNYQARSARSGFRLFVNAGEISRAQPGGSGNFTLEFSLSPESFERGRNVFFLQLDYPEELEQDSTSKALLLNWLSCSLASGSRQE